MTPQLLITWAAHAPIHIAAERGHNKVVTLLLEAGADRDIKNKYGTNLSASCFAGGLG